MRGPPHAHGRRSEPVRTGLALTRQPGSALIARSNRMLLVVRLLAWILLAAIVVLSLVPPTLRPVTPLSHTLEHAGLFFITGALFGLGYPNHAVLLNFGAIAFCLGIEIAQLFIPGRHARLADFFADVIAALAGVLVAVVAGSMRRRLRP